MRPEHWIYTVPLRLRSLFRGRQVEQELDEELQYHVDRLTEENKARGMDPQEARYAALRAMDGLEQRKEECRDARGLNLWTDLGQDIRFGLRMLRRSPGMTLVAVLTLALGIGATTAIFSLMDSIVLRKLPVQAPDELRLLLMRRPGSTRDRDGFTNALWEAVRDQQDVFSGVFAWSGVVSFNLSQGGAVRNINGIFVSGDYFRTLGVSPAVGRLLATSDDTRGCAPVAVLGYGFWQSHFGGATNAIGGTIALNQHSFEIIGVSPPRFHGVEVGKNFDVAVPVCTGALFDRRNIESRSRWWLSVIGRVKPGITPDELKTRLLAQSPAMVKAGVPDFNAEEQQQFLKIVFVTAPAGNGTSFLRRTFGRPLNILMGLAGLVLMIACANIASLLLARATSRGKEIAVRKSLGASRTRLVRQLLTESLLLSFIGTAAGLVFATWGGGVLVRNLASANDPIFVDVALGGRMLAFASVLAMLTGVGVGVLPALQSTGMSLTGAMRITGSEQRSRFHAGKWIVAGQVALSLVLLVGGGLLLRTFLKLEALDVGFDRNNVLVVLAKAPWFAKDTNRMAPERHAATYSEIGRRLRTLPGVVSVAQSFTTPMGDDNWAQQIHLDGPNAASVDTQIWLNFVSPGYFATLRTPLLAGRDFTEQDTRNSGRVAIINQTAAGRFFPGENAIGKHFRWGDEPGIVEVVGIVKDSKYESMRDIPPATVFTPATQMPVKDNAEEFVLRTAMPPSALIAAVQKTVADVDPRIPLEFRTLAELVDDNLVQERLLATLAGFFGGLSLLLAMIGLYGVLSYLVTQRQAEFGIRMALGARPLSILGLVMRDVLTVLMVGVATGVTIALFTVTVLQKLLFGLAPRDTVTMVAAIGVLSAMALLAGYFPARRATRVDPMSALRCE